MCKFIYSMYYYVVYDSAEHYRDLKNDVYMFIYQKLPPVWSSSYRHGAICSSLCSVLVIGSWPTAVNSVCVVQSISKQNSERRQTPGLR